jgi:hypothetical protein
MSNFFNHDKDSEQNQVMTGAEADQEFVIETRKPVNRNLVVLVLIAAVGASLIYLMYLRGRFNADLQTPEQRQSSEAVQSFMAGATRSIDDLEAQLAATERAVKSFMQSSGEGQIPVEGLKVNPFDFEQSKQPVVRTGSSARVIDPAELARAAVGKMRLGMIMVGSNSSATINRQMYRVGDGLEVDGEAFVVKTIERGRVILTHATGDYTLEVASGL